MDYYICNREETVKQYGMVWKMIETTIWAQTIFQNPEFF